jgi:hypothetical protein
MFIITLLPSTPTDLLAYAGTLFTDLWLIISVAAGIPLAFYIIYKVIQLFRLDEKKTKEIIEKADKAIAESRRLRGL